MSRIDEMKHVLYKDLENKCFGDKKLNAYDHLFGTSALCGFLAMQRGLDVEIGMTIGLFHDCSTYLTGSSFRHHLRSSEYARKYLTDSKLYSDDEIKIVVNAISRHSNKDEKDDAYSELIKDGDVLHQYLQQTDALLSTSYENRLAKFK